MLQWRDVLVGAAVTSLLFVIGKSLISWYLGSSAVGSAYGAAGALIVLLFWVYYSVQIFLLGAECTAASKAVPFLWRGNAVVFGLNRQAALLAEPRRC